jgi:hypothetical protein
MERSFVAEARRPDPYPMPCPPRRRAAHKPPPSRDTSSLLAAKAPRPVYISFPYKNCKTINYRYDTLGFLKPSEIFFEGERKPKGVIY